MERDAKSLGQPDHRRDTPMEQVGEDTTAVSPGHRPLQLCSITPVVEKSEAGTNTATTLRVSASWPVVLRLYAYI